MIKKWGDIVFFRQHTANNPNNKLAEKIKKDLISTFQKRGVSVSNVYIDMKTNNVNVRMRIKEK